MHFDFSHKLLINARRKTFYCIKYVHQAALAAYFYSLIFYSQGCTELWAVKNCFIGLLKGGVLNLRLL